MPRARRARIAPTVTRYRYSPTGEGVATRANPQRVDTRPVHDQPLPTRAERDAAIIAQHGGTSRPTHSSSWDQDN